MITPERENRGLRGAETSWCELTLLENGATGWQKAARVGPAEVQDHGFITDNSPVTVTELSSRDHAAGGGSSGEAYVLNFLSTVCSPPDICR